ncbi:doublecortin domain-containing protein 2B isoform X2 [Hypomesus transpacificus]|uniref:doublecortin domain-containing protein 2B isoform X2 n=1 Tax=Hypomesus transpacificus TaxID=137520 RepID=UPI001F07FB78|nr:doublecortin domain-containing protein 2B isoform X2 [Hypomesus transpacificus]
MSFGVGTSTALLPPVKSVVVYRNGDPFHSGRRFVVNQRQVATMEAFLNDVTQNIQAPLAVRTLYTPRQGTRVRDLIDLQSGAQYVAAGFERFKKLNYLNSGQKKLPAARGEGPQVKVFQRPNVSAKWRKYIPVPCIIYVFRNGDLLCPPLRFIIPRGMQRELEQILSLVTERASLRTGAVRRLCTLEGTTLTSADQLETGHYYVAVGTERFKKLPYVELQVPKASERHFPGHRRQRRKLENRKVVSGPEDRYSDSAMLDSPESDGRRVKSTGDEMGDRSAQQAVPRGSGKEESSIFFARPAKVRKNRGQPRPPPRDGAVQTSVFKGGVRRTREELLGAEEVQEDENTTVEIPVDQQVAETVEEEEHRERDSPRKGRKQQSTKETALTEPMNGGAQHQAADGNEPSDEKTRRQLEPQVNSSDRPSPQLDRASSSSDKVHHSPQTDSPISGKASPISGRASPTPRRNSPPLERNSPTSDQASPTSERNSSTSDQASPTPERNSPTSDQGSPTSERNSPTHGKASPISERKSPTSDQASPTSERHSPTLDRGTPIPDRPSPPPVHREHAGVDRTDASQVHTEHLSVPSTGCTFNVAPWCDF